MIAVIAKKANQDPLAALGIPPEYMRSPVIALMVYELLHPKPKDQVEYDEKDEAELDAEAERIMREMDEAESMELAQELGAEPMKLPDVPTLSKIPNSELSSEPSHSSRREMKTVQGKLFDQPTP